MEAKLIKESENRFVLLLPDTNDMSGILASTGEVNSEYTIGNLSLKNCQTIERGYDLDELVKEQYPIDEPSFKRGFKLALEILGNKRFTLEDMMNCWNKALNFQEHKETLGEHIQSLQQTEWDVEIEIENSIALDGHTIIGTEPKLDTDGCLRLKRI